MPVSLEISMLILFPNLEPPCQLRWSLVPLPSCCQTRYIQYHKWRRHFYAFPFPFQLSRSYSLSAEIGPLTPICLELSIFASMVKAFYYCCKSVVRKILPSAPQDTLYRTLIMSFLSCLGASMQIYLWLCCLHLGMWLNCWVCEIHFLLHPSEGVG